MYQKMRCKKIISIAKIARIEGMQDDEEEVSELPDSSEDADQDQ